MAPNPSDGPATDGTEPDGGVATKTAPSATTRWATALVPIVLLAVLVGIVLVFPPFAGISTGSPLPDVSITHATLVDDQIILHVTNNGPPVDVRQLLINDAYWQFTMLQNGQQITTLGTAETARIVVPYHWTPGWDVGVALVLSDGATIHHTIVAPATSPGVTLDLLSTMALIGVLVGVIPIALGMLWFPAMQRMSDRMLHAVLAFSAGILLFLVFDAGFEAFEIAEEVPGAFEGALLVVLGIVGAMVVVQAIMDWKSGDTPSALVLAYGVALGIGLHNLAEGLAIGSAFSLGRVSLGAFLVIGFMVHNVTEGPAIVAPVARGKRPSLWHFAAFGALAGLPTIAGGWIGS
ncbi:MAG: metal transporter, partial [Halobacteriales archaeon]|nr:metal transporter [Halobacteriales archaeon]